MTHDKQTANQINIDHILYQMKSFGFFQISQFLLISTMVFTITSSVNVLVFGAVHVDHKCKNLTDEQLKKLTKIDNKSHVVYETCSIDVYSNANDTLPTDSLKCFNGYEYTRSAEISIISEWDLVCGKNGMAELTQTCFIIGQGLGALAFPVLIERFGRRPTHIICGFSLMLSGLICALSPNLWIFTLPRIFSGILEEGYVISGVTMICELFITRKRSMMTAVFSLVWSTSAAILPSIAYLIRNYGWRVYCFYTAATPLFFIIEIFFLEESIRWLFATGKIKKAKQVIQKACRQNQSNFDTVCATVEKELGKTVDISAGENVVCPVTAEIPDRKTTSPENKSPNTQNEVASFQITEKTSKKTESNTLKLVYIFKFRITRYVTLMNIFNWLVVITCYNSLYMLSEDLAGNMYLNYFLLALMETVASAIYCLGIKRLVVITCYNSLYMLSEDLAGNMYLNYFLLALMETVDSAIYCLGIKRFGHRIPIMSCASLGSASLLAAFFLSKFGDNNSTNKTIFKILHLSAMFGVGSCYGGLYIYTPELYPTDVRSVGIGIASSIARIGIMLSPFSRVLVTYAEWAPSALFGTGLFLSFMTMICFMPETSKRQLPQTMAELKESLQTQKSKAKSDQVYSQVVKE